jgi:uncharacterized protein YuzE
MIYDIESNILSIELSQDAITDTKELGNLIVHVSKIGKPVLIEILDASKLIGKKNKLPSLGQLQNILGEV